MPNVDTFHGFVKCQSIAFVKDLLMKKEKAMTLAIGIAKIGISFVFRKVEISFGI